MGSEPTTAIEISEEQRKRIREELEKHMAEIQRQWKNLLSQHPSNTVIYCQATYDQDYEDTLKCVERVSPHVDHTIIVEDGSLTPEQKHKLETYPNVKVKTVQFKDNLPEYRNTYLEEAKKIDPYGWCLVSDPDELFCEELCREIKNIVKALEQEGYNMAGINCHEAFENVEWLDNLDLLKESPGGYRQSNFYKNLLFKLSPNLRYEGVGKSKTVHETWYSPDIPWRSINLDDRFWYEHRKSALKIWRNAARNVYCTLGNTLILTTLGTKELLNVAKGSLVKGKSFDSVEQHFVHEYSGELIEITALGSLPLSLTPEHRVLVAEAHYYSENGKWKRGIKSLKWKDAGLLKESSLHWYPRHRETADYLVFPKIKEEFPVEKIEFWKNYVKVGKKPKFQKREALNKEQLRAFQRDKHKFVEYVPINEETAELFGYYLAEGSAASGVHLYFGLHEEELAQRAKALIEKYFPYKATITKRPSAIEVSFGGSVLSRFFKSEFGCRATDKRIPHWLLFNKKAILQSFLEAYLKGDGHVDKGRKRYSPEEEYATSSKILAFELQLAFNRLGFFAGIETDKREGEFKFKNRTVYQHDRYIVRVNRKKRYRKFLEDSNNYYLPIYKVRKTTYSGKVHNLKTNSRVYMAQNILVHNCGGGGDNLGDLVPEWLELRRICRELGINCWSEYEAYLKKGKIDDKLKAFLVKCLSLPATNWGTEYREMAKFYFGLHPDEVTPEIMEKIKTVPPMPKESEIEQWVTKCYFDVLGRHPDGEGKRVYTEHILAGRIRREDLPRILMESEEYKQKFGRRISSRG